MNREHHTGLSSELVAAGFYSGEGWEVYWPMATQSKADFMLARGDEYRKVQVKTGTWNRSSGAAYLQVRLTSKDNLTYTDGDCDLIVVVKGGWIWEFPWAAVREQKSLCLMKYGDPHYRPRSKKYDPEAALICRPDNWFPAPHHNR